MKVFFLYFSPVFWFFSRKRSHWLSTANTAQVHVNLVESEKYIHYPYICNDNPDTWYMNLGQLRCVVVQKLGQRVTQYLVWVYSAVRGARGSAVG
jgi:hypothetical protein